MAENLHRTGAEVSVVEMGNQVMAPVDFSIAAHVHQHLSQKGIKLYLERSVERFERQGEKIEVFFSTGESITTDIVLLSIGVHPETTLAKAAGLKIGKRVSSRLGPKAEIFGGLILIGIGVKILIEHLS